MKTLHRQFQQWVSCRKLFLSGLAFLLPLTVLLAQSIQYDAVSSRFSAENIPRLISQSAGGKTPYWLYHWEFGDGHFSYDKTPVHRYAKKGSYQVFLRLTPFYSANRPVMADRTVHVNGASNPTYTATAMGKQFIRMESNTANQVVPNREVRVMVHYRLPAQLNKTTSGYLFLFYNKDGELPHKVKPFTFKGPTTGYFGEMSMPKPMATISQLTNTMQREALQKLRNQFSRVEAFQVSAMKKEQLNRLFFTLTADSNLVKYQDKSRELTVVAVWAPESGWTEADKYQTTLRFSILSVYDPNRIRVEPKTAYVHKKDPAKLRYRVQFQNMGEGDVKQVTIAVPVDKSVQIASTADIRLIDYTPACRECGDAPFDPDTAVCLQKSFRMHPDGDSIVFIFYNIGLEGKKSLNLLENKRSTKGELVFEISGSSKKQAKTKVAAHIDFLGAKEVEITKPATTRWRQKGLFVQAGLVLTPYSESFDGVRENTNLQVGLGYDNAPVGTGISMGGKLALSWMGFRRDTIEVAQTERYPNGAFFENRENLNLTFLDIEATIGFKLGNMVRFSVGAGTAIPAFGQLKTTTNVSYFGDNFMIPVQELNQRIPVGFSKPKTTSLGDVQGLGPTPGLLASWGMEIGLINSITLGFGGEYRFVPGFYNGACLKATNWNTTLRVRFCALKGKKISNQ